jgi:hypothetical protein
MKTAEFLSRLSTLEAEIAALKSEIAQSEPDARPLLFRDLYGIFGGELDTSEEEIEDAEYSFEWEGERMR